MHNDQYACRVCGLLQEEPPWGTDGASPTFGICDCCGVEFGYEDATPAATRRYRETWLGRGAPWTSPKEKPAGWSLERQLEQIPLSHAR
jgi:hypothetical protein